MSNYMEIFKCNTGLNLIYEDHENEKLFQFEVRPDGSIWRLIQYHPEVWERVENFHTELLKIHWVNENGEPLPL